VKQNIDEGRIQVEIPDSEETVSVAYIIETALDSFVSAMFLHCKNKRERDVLYRILSRKEKNKEGAKLCRIQ